MPGDQKDVSPLQGRAVTNNPKRSHRAAAAILAVAIFSLFAVAATVGSGTALAAESFTPKIAINIPTIKFSTIETVNTEGRERGISGYIDVPWIAEYMKGIYSYAVGIAGLLAGVMIVIGGFQYITAGGDAGKIKQARERIAEAVIGLFLVFGAYLILTTISPGLTIYDAIRVKTVKRDPFEQAMQEMFTTTADTIDGFGESGAGSGPAPTRGPAPPVGAHTPDYSGCPVALTEQATSLTAPPGRGRLFKNDPRTRQFFSMMAAQVAPIGNLRDRILAVADAAPLCGVHMNSCGSTAGAILSIAGVGNGPGCFDQSGGHSCWAQESSGMTTPRGGSVSRTLFTDVINSKCGTKNGAPCGAADCAPNGPGAVARARRVLQAGNPAYPDSLANLLQPGDIVWIYNANGGNCTGLHSIIFLGWAANGKAQVTQGSDGTAVHGGQVCLSTRCNGGNNYTPIVRIYRARGL